MYLSINNSTKDTLVDDIVGENIKDKRLILHTNGYVFFNIDSSRVFLHRYIFNCVDHDKYIDHINRDRLDNRYCNLRQCTQKENSRNRSFRIDNKSGYTGVCFHKLRKKWIAKIGVDMKVIHLGYFEDKKLASDAYRKASLKYHKEFSPYSSLPESSGLTD